jgi:hypothetical protein
MLLHALADLLADYVEKDGGPNPVASSAEGRERPARPTGPATPKRRRAPRMPPVIDKAVVVTAENRARALQALLRRGVRVPVRAEEDRI